MQFKAPLVGAYITLLLLKTPALSHYTVSLYISSNSFHFRVYPGRISGSHNDRSRRCLRFGKCYQTNWFNLKIWRLVDSVRLFTKNGQREGRADVGFKRHGFHLGYYEFKDL